MRKNHIVVRRLRRRLFDEFDEMEDCLVQCDKINLENISECLEDGDMELEAVDLTIKDTSPVKLKCSPSIDQKVKYKSINPLLTPIKIVEKGSL